ncbi:MAG: histidine triad nucleotide-binding protein [Elusimicrobiota bacterium]
MEKYDNNCIFCKISAKEVDADIVYEDEKCFAFFDINPQAPVHILVVPREHIADLNKLSKEISSHLIYAAQHIAKKEELNKKGWRMVVNCGPDGGQTVGHVHFHVLGGRQMRWPPG